MSLIQRLLQQRAERKGFFCAVGGVRLAGKSTVAGTLPGSTIIIQPRGIEAGNMSPVRLGQQRGNQVDLIEFGSHNEIFEILDDESILEYDNVYIDGISAFTELVYGSGTFAAKSKKNKWDGFDYIKDQSTQLVTKAKELAETHDKNVFLTYALKPKYDANGIATSVEMVAKGNASKDLVEGKCPNVVAIYPAPVEGQDEPLRKLLTNNNGPYVARLGDMLDTDNPKVLDADLGELLKIVNRV